MEDKGLIVRLCTLTLRLLHPFEIDHTRGRLSIHAVFPNSPKGNWKTRSGEEKGAYFFFVNSIVTLAAASLPVALYPGPKE